MWTTTAEVLDTVAASLYDPTTRVTSSSKSGLSAADTEAHIAVARRALPLGAPVVYIRTVEDALEPHPLFYNSCGYFSDNESAVLDCDPNGCHRGDSIFGRVRFVGHVPELAHISDVHVVVETALPALTDYGTKVQDALLVGFFDPPVYQGLVVGGKMFGRTLYEAPPGQTGHLCPIRRVFRVSLGTLNRLVPDVLDMILDFIASKNECGIADGVHTLPYKKLYSKVSLRHHLWTYRGSYIGFSFAQVSRGFAVMAGHGPTAAKRQPRSTNQYVPSWLRGRDARNVFRVWISPVEYVKAEIKALRECEKGKWDRSIIKDPHNVPHHEFRVEMSGLGDRNHYVTLCLSTETTVGTVLDMLPQNVRSGMPTNVLRASDGSVTATCLDHLEKAGMAHRMHTKRTMDIALERLVSQGWSNDCTKMLRKVYAAKMNCGNNKESLPKSKVVAQLPEGTVHLAKGEDDDVVRMSPMHVAVAQNDAKAVQQLRGEAGSRFQCVRKDLTGKTPLHAAARHGNEDVCRALRPTYDLLRVRDDVGRTPLHIAAMYKHKAIVMMWLCALPVSERRCLIKSCDWSSARTTVMEMLHTFMTEDDLRTITECALSPTPLSVNAVYTSPTDTQTHLTQNKDDAKFLNDLTYCLGTLDRVDLLSAGGRTILHSVVASGNTGLFNVLLENLKATNNPKVLHHTLVATTVGGHNLLHIMFRKAVMSMSKRDVFERLVRDMVVPFIEALPIETYKVMLAEADKAGVPALLLIPKFISAVDRLLSCEVCESVWDALALGQIPLAELLRFTSRDHTDSLLSEVLRLAPSARVRQSLFGPFVLGDALDEVLSNGGNHDWLSKVLYRALYVSLEYHDTVTFERLAFFLTTSNATSHYHAFVDKGAWTSFPMSSPDMLECCFHFFERLLSAHHESLGMGLLPSIISKDIERVWQSMFSWKQFIATTTTSLAEAMSRFMEVYFRLSRGHKVFVLKLHDIIVTAANPIALRLFATHAFTTEVPRHDDAEGSTVHTPLFTALPWRHVCRIADVYNMHPLPDENALRLFVETLQLWTQDPTFQIDFSSEPDERTADASNVATYQHMSFSVDAALSESKQGVRTAFYDLVFTKQAAQINTPPHGGLFVMRDNLVIAGLLQFDDDGARRVADGLLPKLCQVLSTIRPQNPVLSGYVNPLLRALLRVPYALLSPDRCNIVTRALDLVLSTFGAPSSLLVGVCPTLMTYEIVVIVLKHMAKHVLAGNVTIFNRKAPCGRTVSKRDVGREVHFFLDPWLNEAVLSQAHREKETYLRLLSQVARLSSPALVRYFLDKLFEENLKHIVTSEGTWPRFVVNAVLQRTIASPEDTAAMLSILQALDERYPLHGLRKFSFIGEAGKAVRGMARMHRFVYTHPLLLAIQNNVADTLVQWLLRDTSSQSVQSQDILSMFADESVTVKNTTGRTFVFTGVTPLWVAMAANADVKYFLVRIPALPMFINVSATVKVKKALVNKTYTSTWLEPFVDLVCRLPNQCPREELINIVQHYIASAPPTSDAEMWSRTVAHCLTVKGSALVSLLVSAGVQLQGGDHWLNAAPYLVSVPEPLFPVVGAALADARTPLSVVRELALSNGPNAPALLSVVWSRLDKSRDGVSAVAAATLLRAPNAECVHVVCGADDSVSEDLAVIAARGGRSTVACRTPTTAVFRAALASRHDACALEVVRANSDVIGHESNFASLVLTIVKNDCSETLYEVMKVTTARALHSWWTPMLLGQAVEACLARSSWKCLQIVPDISKEQFRLVSMMDALAVAGPTNECVEPEVVVDKEKTYARVVLNLFYAQVSKCLARFLSTPLHRILSSQNLVDDFVWSRAMVCPTVWYWDSTGLIPYILSSTSVLKKLVCYLREKNNRKAVWHLMSKMDHTDVEQRIVFARVLFQDDSAASPTPHPNPTCLPWFIRHHDDDPLLTARFLDFVAQHGSDEDKKVAATITSTLKQQCAENAENVAEARKDVEAGKYSVFRVPGAERVEFVNIETSRAGTELTRRRFSLQCVAVMKELMTLYAPRTSQTSLQSLQAHIEKRTRRLEGVVKRKGIEIDGTASSIENYTSQSNRRRMRRHNPSKSQLERQLRRKVHQLEVHQAELGEALGQLELINEAIEHFGAFKTLDKVVVHTSKPDDWPRDDNRLCLRNSSEIHVLLADPSVLHFPTRDDDPVAYEVLEAELARRALLDTAAAASFASKTSFLRCDPMSVDEVSELPPRVVSALRSALDCMGCGPQEELIFDDHNEYDSYFTRVFRCAMESVCDTLNLTLHNAVYVSHNRDGDKTVVRLSPLLSFVLKLDSRDALEVPDVIESDRRAFCKVCVPVSWQKASEPILPPIHSVGHIISNALVAFYRQHYKDSNVAVLDDDEKERVRCPIDIIMTETSGNKDGVHDEGAPPTTHGYASHVVPLVHYFIGGLGCSIGRELWTSAQRQYSHLDASDLPISLYDHVGNGVSVPRTVFLDEDNPRISEAIVPRKCQRAIHPRALWNLGDALVSEFSKQESMNPMLMLDSCHRRFCEASDVTPIPIVVGYASGTYTSRIVKEFGVQLDKSCGNKSLRVRMLVLPHLNSMSMPDAIFAQRALIEDDSNNTSTLLVDTTSLNRLGDRHSNVSGDRAAACVGAEMLSALTLQERVNSSRPIMLRDIMNVLSPYPRIRWIVPCVNTVDLAGVDVSTAGRNVLDWCAGRGLCVGGTSPMGILSSYMTFAGEGMGFARLWDATERCRTRYRFLPCSPSPITSSSTLTRHEASPDGWRSSGCSFTVSTCVGEVCRRISKYTEVAMSHNAYKTLLGLDVDPEEMNTLGVDYREIGECWDGNDDEEEEEEGY